MKTVVVSRQETVSCVSLPYLPLLENLLAVTFNNKYARSACIAKGLFQFCRQRCKHCPLEPRCLALKWLMLSFLNMLKDIIDPSINQSIAWYLSFSDREFSSSLVASSRFSSLSGKSSHRRSSGQGLQVLPPFPAQRGSAQTGTARAWTHKTRFQFSRCWTAATWLSFP